KAEQALSGPGGGSAGVEPGLLQRGRPIVAQVDGDGPEVGRGGGAQRGDRGGLEFDDLRLVDLEYRRSRCPWQSITACVEAGGQDDHLADTCGDRLAEKRVDVARACRLDVGHAL